MLDLVPDEIAAYCRRHTTPDDSLYQEIIDYTQANESVPQMLSGYQVGAFLQLLVRTLKAKRVLEIGTFTGYSALKLAEALPEDGEVHTCDIDATHVQIARRYAAQAAWGQRVTVHLGPALETVAGLEGPFDLAFIDADKENYPHYYRACLPLMRTGGVLVLDNALLSGRVVGPLDPQTSAIDETNALITADPQVTNVLLPIRDGLMVAYKQ